MVALSLNSKHARQGKQQKCGTKGTGRLARGKLCFVTLCTSAHERWVSCAVCVVESYLYKLRRSLERRCYLLPKLDEYLSRALIAREGTCTSTEGSLDTHETYITTENSSIAHYSCSLRTSLQITVDPRDTSLTWNDDRLQTCFLTGQDMCFAVGSPSCFGPCDGEWLRETLAGERSSGPGG